MSDFVPSVLTPDQLAALLADPGVRATLEPLVTETVAIRMFGRRLHDSYNLDSLAFLAAGILSAQYATLRMQKAARLADTAALLKFAVDAVSLDGLFLEFGVASGTTINYIADLRPQQKIYGFDWFGGLPEDWRPGFGKGAFAMGIPTVRPTVEIVVGLFDRTLPRFCEQFTEGKAAFVHVDCDIYSSAQVIFSHLKRFLTRGSIIAFDEYFNYPGWELHEHRAFREFCDQTNTAYEYIGFVPSHQQVAVRILG